MTHPTNHRLSPLLTVGDASVRHSYIGGMHRERTRTAVSFRALPSEKRNERSLTMGIW